MLENLTSRLGRIINNVIGKYKLSESNIKDILKKFRKSLLEADVSWDVVKCIVGNIRTKLLDTDISRKISPGNMFLKIVNDEFIDILGGKSLNTDFIFKKKNGLDVILLAGLQGVGKTTSVVKLAKYIKIKEKKSCLVVSVDIYRPAAIEQLAILSKKASIECFSDYNLTDSINSILSKVINHSILSKYDFLLIDSAGRLHIDDAMMDEIKLICDISKPSYSFLVIDSMVGQDVLQVASMFCKNIDISGFILTKMDGDSRGGVLLSLSYVTKKPIRFLGVGEGVNDFERFYPDRISSRILGMGDISSLLDDVGSKLDSVESKKLSERVSDDSWDLNDLKSQFQHMSKVGGVKSIMDKLPGVQSLSDSVKNKVNDKFFIDMLAVIDSMTLKERRFPNLINGSRKRRIACGSGTNIQIVNRLLKQYDKMKKVLKKESKKKNIFSSLKDKIFN